MLPTITPVGLCALCVGATVGVLLRHFQENEVRAAALGVKTCPVDTVAAGVGAGSGRPSRRTAARTVQLIADSAGEPGPELLNGTSTDCTVPTAAVAATRGAVAPRSAGGACHTGAGDAAAVTADVLPETAFDGTRSATAGAWIAVTASLFAGTLDSGAEGAGLTGRFTAAGDGLSLPARLSASAEERAGRARSEAREVRGEGAEAPEEPAESEEEESVLEAVSSAGAAAATPIEPVATAAPIPSAIASPPTRPIAPAARMGR
jgi:hypothetical protein